MKVIFALLVLVGFQAQAQTVEQFVGRFKPVQGECVDQGSRVYIKAGPSAWGQTAMSLYVQTYGDDARAQEILLGSGKRQAPGTSVEYHGEVIQAWVTQINGSVLESVETITRPSVGLRYQTRFVVKTNGRQLSISETQTSEGKTSKEVVCVLERY